MCATLSKSYKGLTKVYFETEMMTLVMTGQPLLSNDATELNSLQLDHQF